MILRMDVFVPANPLIRWVKGRQCRVLVNILIYYNFHKCFGKCGGKREKCGGGGLFENLAEVGGGLQETAAVPAEEFAVDELDDGIGK